MICPELRRIVQESSRVARRPDRERPGRGRRGGRRQRPARARRIRRAAPAPLVVYTGTFEAYQGLDLLFAAAALVRAARPDAQCCSSAGRRSRCRARARRPRAAASDAVDLHRASGLLRRSRHSRSGRRARVAPQPWHEHAAEDLSVPALGPADRGHTLLTHTQVLDDDSGHPHGRVAAGVRGRHSGALRIRAMRARVGGRAASSPRRSTATRLYIERRAGRGAPASPVRRRGGGVA